MRDHKVIFFRGQKHLDEVEHERLVTILAKLRQQHPLGRPSVPSSMAATDSDDHWSTNITCQVEPGLSVLRPLAIAPGRRETAWSNMRAAYLDLPPPLRKLADELWAVHNDDSPETGDSEDAEVNTKVSDHPVVRIHPETGERVLALGNFGGRSVGLQRDTGQKLFDMLQSYIIAPENAVRWSWRVGDVAIWGIAQPSTIPSMTSRGAHLSTTSVASCRPARNVAAAVSAVTHQSLRQRGLHEPGLPRTADLAFRCREQAVVSR